MDKLEAIHKIAYSPDTPHSVKIIGSRRVLGCDTSKAEEIALAFTLPPDRWPKPQPITEGETK